MFFARSNILTVKMPTCPQLGTEVCRTTGTTTIIPKGCASKEPSLDWALSRVIDSWWGSLENSATGVVVGWSCWYSEQGIQKLILQPSLTDFLAWFSFAFTLKLTPMAPELELRSNARNWPQLLGVKRGYWWFIVILLSWKSVIMGMSSRCFPPLN